MTPPPTVRAFLAGLSGSGKSTAAWRLYLSRFPRRLLIDQTGEWERPNPAMGYPGPDVVVFSVPELTWALQKYGPTGRWTIALELGLDDLPDLVSYLVPVPNVTGSPVLAVGGAVVLVDEVDLVAPPRSVREEVRTLWRRSRHVGLSIVATTQRPEAVSREVSAQSHQVLAFHLVEPRALDYMSELMQTDLAGLQAWTRKHPHGALWREIQTGRTLWLTDAGTFVKPARGPVARDRGQTQRQAQDRAQAEQEQAQVEAAHHARPPALVPSAPGPASGASARGARAAAPGGPDRPSRASDPDDAP